MAHTKAQKTVKGNRDSAGRRLGVKVFGEGKVDVGYIVLRQRGSTVGAGEGTKMTKDYTIMAIKKGVVKFFKKRSKKYIKIV